MNIALLASSPNGGTCDAGSPTGPSLRSECVSFQ